MSLLELILGQKIIIISLGGAVLLLFTAVLITVVGRWREDSARRARRKAQETQLVQADQAAPVAQTPPAVPVKEVSAPGAPSRSAAPISPTKPDASTAATIPRTAVQTASATASVATTAAPDAPAATPPVEAPAGGQPASMMQDILSSVFVDEDAQARYAVLLSGLDSIDVSDLLALCQKVAGQLGTGGQPLAANKEPSQWS